MNTTSSTLTGMSVVAEGVWELGGGAPESLAGPDQHTVHVYPVS